MMRYQDENILLGRGTYGSVYRAVRKSDGLKVAIKKIDKKRMEKQHMKERVENEVNIHSKLHHTSIVKVYDYFQDNEYVYLVLELCQKGTLHEHLKSRQRLTEDEARGFMQQIVEGVLYLHEHGIVHRDLSLANILLTADMKVKISDFGVATQLQVPEEKHTTMCGTPNYMCPEIASKREHGLEADLWSLGCILYTLLEGRPPFDGDNPHIQVRQGGRPPFDRDGLGTVFNRIINQDYIPPRSSSSDACDLITALLRDNPRERLSLREILDHPFMTRKQDPVRLTQRMREMSVDSGRGTITTTKYSSSSSVSAFSSRNHPVTALPLRQELLPVRSNTPQDLKFISNNGKQKLLVSESDEYRICDLGVCSREGPELMYTCQHSVCSSVCSRGNSDSNRDMNTTNSSHRHMNGTESNPRGQSPCLFQPDTAKAHLSQCSRTSFDTGQIQANKMLTGFGINIHLSQSQDLSQLTSTKPACHLTQAGVSGTQNSQAQNKLRKVPNSLQSADETQEGWTNQFLSPRLAEKEVKLTEHQVQKNVTGNGQVLPESSNITVAPFNTQRLMPFRQYTPHLVINILKDGKVSMETIRRKQETDRVIEVMLISADGKQIQVYRPAGSKGVPLADSPPSPPVDCKTFEYPSIPQKYIKRYHLAVRLIYKVKTRTPKVTLYTDQAKCMLMENAPNPDFTAEFYDGSKVSFCENGWSILEHDGSSTNLESVHEISLLLSSETRARLEHARNSHDWCIKTEKFLSSVESDMYQPFPSISGRRPRNIPFTNTNRQIPAGNKSVQGGNDVKTLNVKPQVLMSPSGADSLNVTENHVLDCTPTRLSSTSSSHSSQTSGQQHKKSSQVKKEGFIQDMGWFLITPGSDICFYFLDGTKIVSFDKPASYTYTDATRKVHTYSKGDQVPDEVRTKIKKTSQILAVFDDMNQNIIAGMR